MSGSRYDKRKKRQKLHLDLINPPNLKSEFTADLGLDRLIRAKTLIGLQNLCYNMRRLVQPKNKVCEISR